MKMASLSAIGFEKYFGILKKTPSEKDIFVSMLKFCS
jgi:hypothetical protein